MSEITKLRVCRPKSCDATKLNIDGITSMERDLAYATQIFVGDKVLLAQSFKLTPKGTLLVEVQPECFELTNFE